MKYKGKWNIREQIIEMSHITSKLKTLKLELSDNLLVHLVLILLPARFSQFKVSYNCQKEKWTLNKLILYCVQQEEMLKQEKTEIEAIGTFRLLLGTDHYLDLKDIFVVPSFRRN
ncbi:hypothetical protein ACOSQ2_014497 [Xanthoceras sorbifolium]